MRLCLEDLPDCFPGSETNSWQISNCLFSKSLQVLQSSIHWTIQETQPTSKSITSFPLFQSSDVVCIRQIAKGLLKATLKGLQIVILFSLLFVKIAGINYIMDPPHLGQAGRSHGCCQMNYFQTVDPLKFRFHRAPGTSTLYSTLLSPETRV